MALAAGAQNQPWLGKDFKDWTNADAQAIMRESPWTKRFPIPPGRRPSVTVVEPVSNGAPLPTASLGNPSNNSAGSNRSTGGNAGSPDPSGAQNAPLSSTPSALTPPISVPDQLNSMTVIWASATPIRLAILKLRSGTTPPSEQEVENASKPHDHYVVAVSGLGSPDEDFDPQTLARKASLTIKGRPTIVAADSNYRRIGNSDVYFLRFRRDALPINLSDQQVEFKVIFGTTEIKKKFVLKDMQFLGRLAL